MENKSAVRELIRNAAMEHYCPQSIEKCDCDMAVAILRAERIEPFREAVIEAASRMKGRVSVRLAVALDALRAEEAKP